MQRLECVQDGKFYQFELDDIQLEKVDGKLSSELNYLIYQQFFITGMKEKIGSFVNRLRKVSEEDCFQEVGFICQEYFQSMQWQLQEQHLFGKEKNMAVLKELEDQKESVCKIILYKIMETYYQKKLGGSKKSTLVDCFLDVTTLGKDSLLERLGETYQSSSMSHIAVQFMHQALLDNLLKHGNHLCGSDVCDVKTMVSCPKILDEVKKSITEYPFITSGNQLFDSENGLVSFGVYGCSRCQISEKEQEKEQKILVLK